MLGKIEIFESGIQNATNFKLKSYYILTKLRGFGTSYVPIETSKLQTITILNAL
jgi:hypothetical protein